MRPSFLRRVIAGLAALAFVVALGLEALHALTVAASKIDESAVTMATDASVDYCGQCGSSSDGTATDCRPICAPSVAVLPLGEAIERMSLPGFFETRDMTRVGRTGAPEPHPPKSTSLL